MNLALVLQNIGGGCASPKITHAPYFLTMVFQSFIGHFPICRQFAYFSPNRRNLFFNHHPQPFQTSISHCFPSQFAGETHNFHISDDLFFQNKFIHEWGISHVSISVSSRFQFRGKYCFQSFIEHFPILDTVFLFFAKEYMDETHVIFVAVAFIP